MSRKIKLLTLQTFVCFIFFSCEKDLYEDFELHKKNYDAKIKTISETEFKEKLKLLNKNTNIEKFLKSSKNAQNQLKTSLGGGVEIYTDDIKEITYENYTSYSMYLKMPSTTNQVFYNFIIEEKNNDLSYTVNKYVTSNDWINNQNENFKGTVSTFSLSSTSGSIVLAHFTDLDDGPNGMSASALNDNTLYQQYPNNCNGIVETVIIYEPKMCSANQHWPWTPTFNNPCTAAIKASFINTTYYRCLLQSTGGTGSNNPGGGNNNPGGGNSTDPSNPNENDGPGGTLTSIVPTIENEKKPCEELVEKDGNPVFSSKMVELKTKAGTQNFESAHALYQNAISGLIIGDEFTGDTNAEGEGREVNLSLNASSTATGTNSIGFMHCHLDNGTTFKVFSLDDIIALALVAELSTRPTNEFVAYVTTNSGTLALKINNRMLLTSKIDMLDMTYNDQERGFEKLIDKSNSYSNQKLGLVKFLSNMPLLGSIGLDLYEKIGNNWNKLGLSADGNSVTNTPCNQ